MDEYGRLQLLVNQLKELNDEKISELMSALAAALARGLAAEHRAERAEQEAEGLRNDNRELRQRLATAHAGIPSGGIMED